MDTCKFDDFLGSTFFNTSTVIGPFCTHPFFYSLYYVLKYDILTFYQYFFEKCKYKYNNFSFRLRYIYILIYHIDVKTKTQTGKKKKIRFLITEFLFFSNPRIFSLFLHIFLTLIFSFLQICI